MMHGRCFVGIQRRTVSSRLKSSVGLLLMALAITSALAITRGLTASDHVERSHIAAFPTRPMRTLNLGTSHLPSPGTLRLVLCPPDGAPAITTGGSFLVLSRDRAQLAREELTHDESRGRRCLEATAHASGSVTVTAELSTAASTQVSTAERFTHPRFTFLFALPTIAFVLGLALVLFRKKDQGPSALSNTQNTGDSSLGEPSASAAAYRPSPEPEPAPNAPNAPYAPPVPPVQWPWAWAYAIGGYIAVQLVNALFVIAWIAVYRPADGVDGTTIAVSTLSQHALMILVSFALLGAFQTDSGRGLARDWRQRLQWTPITLKGAALSALAAGLLVAIAIGSTRLIPDLNASPMGKLLERSPARFAIAFGALIAPFSEELFFRGVLGSAFGQKSVWRGAFISVVVFTLAHAAQLSGAAAGLIPIFAVGLTNAILRAKTNSLAYPWLVHTMYNGALTASLYFV
jgi:membrane protease YdiL (CAAX protease family)